MFGTPTHVLDVHLLIDSLIVTHSGPEVKGAYTELWTLEISDIGAQAHKYRGNSGFTYHHPYQTCILPRVSETLEFSNSHPVARIDKNYACHSSHRRPVKETPSLAPSPRGRG